MEKIVRKNGYVYLVQDWDKKGFETYYNLGKDVDDPMWKDDEIIKEVIEEIAEEKIKKRHKKEDTK